MRWWKRFREDLDRPAFQAGIEKFGTGFSHDVDRVWQLLCVEDGPGIRDLPLTDETISILARQFRATPEEAKERLDFMCKWGLAEIKTARDGESQFISSPELKRRRDEWSKRKSRESKEKQKKQTPERLKSGSRETPEQRSDADAKAEEEEKLHVTADKVTRCAASFPGDVFEYCGLRKAQIAASLAKKRWLSFEQRFRECFKSYPEAVSHVHGECTCSVADFLEETMESLRNEGVRWPRALLSRKKELEKITAP